MKTHIAIAVASVSLALSGLAPANRLAAAQAGAPPAQMAQTVCAQVISCGTKDGKVKEYATPCDARADGATDIHPKTGPTCDAAKE